MSDDVTLISSQKYNVVASCYGGDGSMASGGSSDQELDTENVVAGWFRGWQGKCLPVQYKKAMLL